MKKHVIIIRNAKSYDFGGGERFPIFLAEVLKKEHYTPLIISRSKKLLCAAANSSVETRRGWWWSKQDWSGHHNLIVPAYFIWQLILTFWYLSVFIRERPSVVHIQSKDDFISATVAGKLIGATIVWTDHADLKHIWLNLRTPYKNPIGKLIYLTAKLTDAITLVSKSELKLVSKNLPKNSPLLKKIHVIYNGTTNRANEYKITKNKSFTFCSVSRMVTDKGIGEIIDAFSYFYSKHPNSRLLLIGDGPEENKFKTLASSNKNIILLGYRPDPLKYMASCDVYVHATYHEGFSVSLVEASMLGLPIIATKVGGNLEIITNKKTGLLVQPKDSLSIQDAMEELYNSKELRNGLGINARQQYEKKFQFDQIVKNKFLKLYEN